MTGRHEPWRVHAALAGAQVGFALFPIFGKLALASIPALPFAAFRVTAAAVLLDAIRRAHGGESVRKADRPRLVLYALLGVSFNQILFISGLALTTAIHTTILITTIPVFTLAAAVLLRKESLTARAAAGILLAGAGVALVLWALTAAGAPFGVLCLSGAVVYPVLVLAFGGLGREDIAMLLRRKPLDV